MESLSSPFHQVCFVFHCYCLDTNEHSYSIYYPSIQGTMARYGIRLSMSSQSRVLFGFVLYSTLDKALYFVLYDLYYIC